MSKNLRIILFDIETIPNLRAALESWPQLSDFPGKTMRATINSVLCFGWKVLGQKQVNCINAWDFPEQWDKSVNDDSRVVETALEVLRGADLIVTHNGKSFDFKFLQTRLLKHKFGPLPKLLHIDTKAEAKKNLFLLNNRLTTAARFLTNTDKLENGGWDLWVDVYDKKPKAMALMEKYCKRDVTVLEAVFNELKPMIKLPNQNMFFADPVCPTCGSKDLQARGDRITLTAVHKRFQCKACGAWASAKKDKVTP